MKFKPRPYQKIASDFVYESLSALLLLDMGLGKTASSLHGIMRLMKAGEVKQPLIIAPKIVSENQWAQEVEKWDQFRKWFKINEIDATSVPKRNEQADRIKPMTLTIVSESKVNWLMRYYAKKRIGEDATTEQIDRELKKGKWPFDLIVIDEISLFKHGNTKRFKELKNFTCPPGKKAKRPRVIGLTGTPTPSGAKNLWSIMMLVDGGQRLGKTERAFKLMYGHEETYIGPDGVPHKRTEVGDDAMPTILSHIDDIALAMRAKDHLDEQPDMDIIRHEVHIGAYGMKLSAEAIQSALSVTTTKKGREIVVSAETVLEGVAKALQFTSGACYVSEAEGDLYDIAHDRHREKVQRKVVSQVNKDVEPSDRVGNLEEKAKKARRLDRKFDVLTDKQRAKLFKLERALITSDYPIKTPKRFLEANNRAVDAYKEPKRIASRKARKKAKALGMTRKEYQAMRYKERYEERMDDRIEAYIKRTGEEPDAVAYSNMEIAVERYAMREAKLDAEGRTDTSNKLIVYSDDRKIKALKELVASIDEPIFLLYHYRHEYDRIKELYPDAELLNTKTAPDIIPRWNNGEIKLLLANPKSTKFGLNMQDGGRHLVWFSLFFSYEEFVQTNARLARQGQKRKVYCHILEAVHTIDTLVINRLTERDELNDQVFDVLQGKAEKVTAKSIKSKIIEDVKNL